MSKRSRRRLSSIVHMLNKWLLGMYPLTNEGSECSFVLWYIHIRERLNMHVGPLNVMPNGKTY